MLNIGLLAPGAGEYYIGEVASSAEDYYTGRGESVGRWVGSLAAEIGLAGDVEPEQFRSVLAGRDPHTLEQLVHRKPVGSGEALVLDPDRSFDVSQAAAVLGVSGRYVRRLLEDGERYTHRLEDVAGSEVAPPKRFLVGVRRRDSTNQPGPVPWKVSGAELQRFAASRTEKKFRPGYDLTLRPPKSVSVLWALGSAEIARSVRDAHTAAVDEVVTYYERQAVRAREPGSGRRVETDGIIAAAFDHRTSRAGDPLLHTHVVTANMTRLRTECDGELWRSVESSALFDHAKAAGCLYQAHLRHELTQRLGVRFAPVTHGHAEVVGVPDAVVDLFSKRRNEIEEELAASGRTTARSAQVATLETRKAKDYSVDADTLTARWATEAAAIGFGAADAKSCTGTARSASINESEEQRILDILGGQHGLCERSSTFRRSDVVETVASLVGSSATARQVDELAARFVTSELVVEVNSNGTVSGDRRRSAQRRWTTVDLAQLEARLLQRADDMVTGDHLVPTGVTADVVAVRAELSEEQARMVETVCASSRFVLPVEGRPGAGKTYATEAVVAAHVTAGVPIVGCAVSAAAASELESQAGFARSVTEATTVAKLLHDLDRFDGFAQGTAVVVDEASMIGTRDLARLADHADRCCGRMILVGDPDQHGSVDAGGVFTRLCHLRGNDTIRLVENRRQSDHVDRLAIDDYREGLIADAMQRLDDADRIVRSATAGESFDAMAADWYAARLSGSADPMIAGPNSTRRALNERARVLLATAGELQGSPLRIGGREFCKGDEVVARRNDRTLHALGSKDFVKNGSVGVVREVHHKRGELIVAFEHEGTITMPKRYLAAGRLEHGYARTTYGVQGHTHDVARYHPTDASGFEEGYVAVTRGRSGSRLYVVDGTVAVDQDTHHSRATERHTLDDINTAFGRRRANTMAAEVNPALDRVAELANTHTLADLRRRRSALDRELAAAPVDTSRVIAESTRAREALQVRQRVFRDVSREDDSAGLQRRIEHLDRRITGARQQQAEREAWLDDHIDLVEEHRVTRDAERAVEARIRHRPIAHLPTHIVEALGPEPSLQRENQTWSAAAIAVAIHLHRHGSQFTLREDLDGSEALLGARPQDRDAAISWDFAAEKVSELAIDVDQAIEPATGL